MKTLHVQYHDLLRDAEDIGKKLAQFLGIDLNLEAMTRQVDATPQSLPMMS